jgi:hypothetical protein
MEEQERVPTQVLTRNSDNVPGASEPCRSVSYAPFGLEASHPQPMVNECEPLAAMVVLPIVDPNRASVVEHRAVPRHTVRNRREKLRQVERRVGVMTNPEKEHLPVQIVHPTDRTLRDMRRKGEGVGDDPGGFRPGRRKGVEVMAPPYTGQSPEGIRHDSEARRRCRGHRIEGLVVLPRPRRHHQGAGGANGIAESLEQAERSSLDRPGSPEGRV